MPARPCKCCTKMMNLQKMDPTTGAILWTALIPGDGIRPDPSVTSGSVGSYDLFQPSAMRIEPLHGTNDILVGVKEPRTWRSLAPNGPVVARVDSTGSQQWHYPGHPGMSNDSLTIRTRIFGSDSYGNVYVVNTTGVSGSLVGYYFGTTVTKLTSNGAFVNSVTVSPNSYPLSAPDYISSLQVAPPDVSNDIVLGNFVQLTNPFSGSTWKYCYKRYESSLSQMYEYNLTAASQSQGYIQGIDNLGFFSVGGTVGGGLRYFADGTAYSGGAGPNPKLRGAGKQYARWGDAGWVGATNIFGVGTYIAGNDFSVNKVSGLWADSFSDCCDGLDYGNAPVSYFAGKIGGRTNDPPYVGTPKPVILKVDAQGNMLWSQAYGRVNKPTEPDLLVGRPTSICIADDGFVYVSGTCTYAP